MAEMRQAKPATVQAAGKGPGKASSKAQPAGIAGIRQDLAKARRDHRMQTLDSPAKLRATRKSLARALTAERTAQQKETNG